MKKILPFLLLVAVLTGCNKLKQLSRETTESQSEVALTFANTGAEEKSDEQRQPAAEERPTVKFVEMVVKKEEEQSGIPKKIIHDANIRFQVQDIKKSHETIAKLLQQYKAYFGHDNSSTSRYENSYDMSIRVPANSFEPLISAIMNESVYTNFKNISADDVTADFVDTEARLKTKKEVEQRYIALLKQSNKITDILEVEEKLRVIREEIEATEGHLKLMKDQVAYSTITLNIYQKLEYTIEPATSFLSDLKEAFVGGWRFSVNAFLAQVHVWPFAILVFGLITWLVKRRKKRLAVA